MIGSMAVLRTARLALREFTLADLDALMDVFGDAEVMRYGDGVQCRAWVQAWIERCRIGYGAGHAPWAVDVCASDVTIGYCGLTAIPDLAGRDEIELGYRLARQSWGHGYATEAARAVIEYALRDIGLARVVARVDPGNTASVRVVEKIGMRHERDVLLPGYTHPDRLYVIERQL
jgi:[ribosomal protein S5]-alanine N-acetyltransferase